ncbi:hypothetical protein NP233_g584 [Leucocoprinus birnbaumii]|uniref:Origin recognition complex subunit 4 n=1 Tax=Leucocoprinus birnbaumii TaxID=56174 RepID=A0AAD5YWK8_9AGAR|nr:hypothetical protein NP233_g584 [Leucocoprinus birnbaumii]
MPPKRKAVDNADISPSKRSALSETNATGHDTPSRRTRSAKPAVATTTPIATPTPTPRVRRTYGKKTQKAQEALQEVINSTPDHTNDQSDSKPETNPAVPSPPKTRERKKVAATQDSPSKRRSKRASAVEKDGPKPVETPTKVKRTYGKKVVVEIPPLASPLRALSPGPQSPSPIEVPCDIPVTPRKSRATILSNKTPSKTYGLLASKHLPSQFYPCLNAQKKAILQSLHSSSDICSNTEGDNDAKRLLQDLLQGTVTRSEGNSCLLLGPRGSGKSMVLEQCLTALSDPPIVIRLSGWIHHTDRLAMREIAYQLGQQTGKSFLQEDEEEKNDPFAEQDDNPFLDRPNPQAVETGLALPPPSHLPALISIIPTLSRPTIVVLDAFDLFALHPRQALLYCLLDTVQGCRTGMDNKGLAVVGTTTRIDTINLLEKRVKSRFSGRVIRTSGISATADILSLTKKALCTPLPPAEEYEELMDEWNDAWAKRISECLDDKEVADMMKDTIGVMKDPKLVFRILIYAVTRLSPDAPFLTRSSFSQAIQSQRSRPPLYDTLDFPYPALCLVISAVHSITSGHDTFTFEMLFSTFRNQVKASTAAPVQINGGSIGMVPCSRAVLLSAFEHLISSRIFIASTAYSNSIAKEFFRYRTTLEKDDVKKVIEKAGQVTLKKWLNKAE